MSIQLPQNAFRQGFVLCRIEEGGTGFFYLRHNEPTGERAGENCEGTEKVRALNGHALLDLKDGQHGIRSSYVQGWCSATAACR